MKLIYMIVNFMDINFDDVIKHFSNYGYNIKVSFRLNGINPIINISDKDTNISISTLYINQISKETKDQVLANYLENNGEIIDKFYQLYKDIDYEFAINIDSDKELEFAYIFAQYITKKTKLGIINTIDDSIFYSDDLQSLSNDSLLKIVKHYLIKEKYFPCIRTLINQKSRCFNATPLFFGTLIFSSIFSSVALVLMILVYKIENYFILSLPFILIAIFYGGIIIKWALVFSSTTKKIEMLSFEYKVEMCKLNNNKIPKKPSNKKKSTKQFVIDTVGILIPLNIIIGSVLIALNMYMLGIFVIILPWCALFGIKKFITDNKVNEMKKKLYLWLDNCLNQDISKEIVVLNFILYERNNNNWEVEVVGDTSIDDSIGDFSRDNKKVLNKENFTFSKDDNWENIQFLMCRLVKEYFNTNGIDILARLKAISLGFVDDTINYIYFNEE